jgi:hypothetical protein
VQPQVASLFQQRQSERVGDLDDDDNNKDDENEKDKSNKLDQFKNNIKSRKAFSMAINDKTMPSSIMRLSRTAHFVIMCLIALAISDYAIVFKQIKDTIINFEVIDNSYLMIAEIQKVCYNVRTMVMLNENLIYYYYGFNSSLSLFTSIQTDLQNSLKLLYNIQNDINLSQLKISQKHSELMNDKTINMYFK